MKSRLISLAGAFLLSVAASAAIEMKKKLEKLFYTMVLTLFTIGNANLLFADERGSNKTPLSFGEDQTIVDLSKVVWEPLAVDGLEPGAEIAVLRGDLGKVLASRYCVCRRTTMCGIIVTRATRPTCGSRAPLH